MLSGVLFPTTVFSLPYDWKDKFLEGTVTRCFASQRIQVHCEDLSEPDWGIKDRAELQIEAKDPMDRVYSYSYEHGLPGSLCREHHKKIVSLLRGVKQACITGGIEWASQDSGVNVTNAKWQALESSRGRVVW